jgi:hypothetical protein
MKLTMYLVMNIGCIECGVSSQIVGLFANKAVADSVAEQCDKLHDWRQHGQNRYEVLELPTPECVHEEYAGVVVNG